MPAENEPEAQRRGRLGKLTKGGMRSEYPPGVGGYARSVPAEHGVERARCGARERARCCGMKFLDKAGSFGHKGPVHVHVNVKTVMMGWRREPP